MVTALAFCLALGVFLFLLSMMVVAVVLLRFLRGPRVRAQAREHERRAALYEQHANR